MKILSRNLTHDIIVYNILGIYRGNSCLLISKHILFKVEPYALYDVSANGSFIHQSVKVISSLYFYLSSLNLSLQISYHG